MKMKLVVLMALTLAACEKQETPPPAAPETPAATPAPPSTPVAVAPPSDIAPDGIFFLTQKVSIETSDGIIGFKPGEPVKFLKQGVYVVQDGTPLTLRPEQVTNSISRGRALSTNDANTQALIAQQRARTPVPTPFVAPPPPQPQPLAATPALFVPTATSMGADSVHNKTRSYYDQGLRRWVTVNVN